MKKITHFIRIGAALVFALVLAFAFSTANAAVTASSASDCDSDPYCHWIPNWTTTCNDMPCYSDEEQCCLP